MAHRIDQKNLSLGRVLFAIVTVWVLLWPNNASYARGFPYFFKHFKPSGACGFMHEVPMSFYWSGHHTATGARFDANGNTAAHRSLPFGTKVSIRNPRNGRERTITVNDRGPYGIAHELGVKFDLARGAASRLGMKATEWMCFSIQ